MMAAPCLIMISLMAPFSMHHLLTTTRTARAQRTAGPSQLCDQFPAPPSDILEEEAIKLTLKWLDNFIIRHQLCPFAAPVRRHTRTVVCMAMGDGAAATLLRQECTVLRAIDSATPATTLVVLPRIGDFEDLMDLQVRAEAMANEDEAASAVQFLAFHPQAEFGEHDAADFSMRSPLPMLHLLRDDDVVAAEEEWEQQHAPGPTPGIQERNAALLRGMGYTAVAELVSKSLS